MSLDDLHHLLIRFKLSQVKWFDAGLKLGLDKDTLEAIQRSYHSDKECFKEMLKQMITDPHPPPKLRCVQKALNI